MPLSMEAKRGSSSALWIFPVQSERGGAAAPLHSLWICLGHVLLALFLHRRKTQKASYFSQFPQQVMGKIQIRTKVTALYHAFD